MDQRGRSKIGVREERSEREGWIREIKEGPLGVWLSPLFIEPSYVTKSELVERKLSKSGKNFDKISGLLFFWPKEESLRLNG